MDRANFEGGNRYEWAGMDLLIAILVFCVGGVLVYGFWVGYF